MQPVRHIDGQIAFYKAELKITDAQSAQWNAFADALRGSAARLHQTMAHGADGEGRCRRARADAAADHDAHRPARCQGRRLLAAAAPLYAVLTDEQKKVADELMAERVTADAYRGDHEVRADHRAAASRRTRYRAAKSVRDTSARHCGTKRGRSASARFQHQDEIEIAQRSRAASRVRHQGGVRRDIIRLTGQPGVAGPQADRLLRRIREQQRPERAALDDQQRGQVIIGTQNVRDQPAARPRIPIRGASSRGTLVR